MKPNPHDSLKVVAAGVMIGMILGGAVAAQSNGSELHADSPPPARKIPGITAPDQFPGGCVDCHVYYPELKLDVRISTLMKDWADGVGAPFLKRMQALSPAGEKLKGRHPAVSPAMFEDIPGSCIRCHDRPSKKAPAFGQMMHVIHLGGVKDGHFLSMFQGECTHCHKLDSVTGVWKTPGGRERSVDTQAVMDTAVVTNDMPGAANSRAHDDAIGTNIFPLLLIFLTGAAVCACFATISWCQGVCADAAGCRGTKQA